MSDITRSTHSGGRTPSTEWPFRGTCLGVPKQQDLDVFRRLIAEILPRYGCNALVLLVRYRYRFQHYPEVSDTGALTRAQAAEIGLVSRTVPDAELLDAALDLADRINGWSTQGVQLTKRMMWAGLETSSLAAAIELESHTQLFVRLTTRNFEEATRARKEGRKPVFED